MTDWSFLSNIFLFQNLDDAQTAKVRGMLHERTFHAEDKIIEEGFAGESLFIITSGRVQVFRTFDNEKFVLTELGSYDFFGEMSLIDDFAASATVETLTEVTVVEMTRKDFKSLVNSDTEISARLWESLARSLSSKIRNTGNLVKMYYGLNKALCEDKEFRELYTAWNFGSPTKR